MDISSNTFTNISDFNYNKHWLDHVVSLWGIYDCINSLSILDGFITSDHNPLQIVLKKFLILNLTKENISQATTFVGWWNLSDLQIRIIQ